MVSVGPLHHRITPCFDGTGRRETLLGVVEAPERSDQDLAVVVALLAPLTRRVQP